MKPDTQQIIRLNALLGQLNITDMKRDLITQATGGRTDRTKLMTGYEIEALIVHLSEKLPETGFRAANKKRRRVLSLCHQLPEHLGFTHWDETKQSRTVDMDRLNNWLLERGKYKKKLNHHAPLELSSVIVQFENMLKGYLKQ